MSLYKIKLKNTPVNNKGTRTTIQALKSTFKCSQNDYEVQTFKSTSE